MIKIFKSISTLEWRWWSVIVVVMILVTTLPLIYGWLITPVGKVFTAASFAAPNDWFVYYSHITQVLQGKIFFIDLYTSQPHLATFNIFWLIVGLAAKFLKLSPVEAFQFFRVLLMPVFYLVAYLFLSYLFVDRSKRLLGLVMLSVSSGLGFLLLDRLVRFPTIYVNGVVNWPFDLWVYESNTFLTLMSSPHFIASLTLILLVFLFTLLAVDYRQLRYGLASGFCALVLFSFHPFHVLTIFSVIGVYFALLIWQQRRIIWWLVLDYLILLLVASPAILYYLILMQFDQVLNIKAARNLTFTTPPWITFFAYGLLLVFAVWGSYGLFRDRSIKNFKWLFVVVWAVVQLVVIYFPVNYQRRMSEGLHFPLVVLTVVGLFCALAYFRQRPSGLIYQQRYLIGVLLGFLFIASNLFQLAVNFYLYTNPGWLYRLDGEVVEAAEWLAAQADDAVIFNSAGNIINIVPAYSGRRVYVGHGVETPYFGLKQQEVNWFFKTDRSSDIERNFLHRRQIDLLFYGPQEKELGSYDPAGKDYLKEIYANSLVKIYQVL
ncbi:MAG: hypothetical protein RB292_04380 [Patescibacteria group bacterium]|jgi:hypothetical protein|nr:hypothetical protein [Patescibacteria group bacterium]